MVFTSNFFRGILMSKETLFSSENLILITAAWFRYNSKRWRRPIFWYHKWTKKQQISWRKSTIKGKTQASTGSILPFDTIVSAINLLVLNDANAVIFDASEMFGCTVCNAINGNFFITYVPTHVQS